MSETAEKVWVSVTSHRARGHLERIAGEIGTDYGVLPDAKSWPPRGEYYPVPAVHAEALRNVKGIRVLRGTPGNGAKLFRRISAELGEPERGNWPVPHS